MLRKPTTSETGVDLPVGVIPHQELVGRVRIVALIEHMHERRTGEVTLAYVEAETNESIKLILV